MEATFTSMLQDSSINGIVGNFRDVTSRKLAEKNLIDNEHKYRVLLENSAGMAILSVVGKPLYVSESIKNILGYTHQEAMELNLITLAHPDDAALVTNIIQRAIANPGMPVKGDATRMRHKDGNWRWNGEEKCIVGNWKIILDDRGAPLHLIGTCQDITERKQAEEKTGSKPIS